VCGPQAGHGVSCTGAGKWRIFSGSRHRLPRRSFTTEPVKNNLYPCISLSQSVVNQSSTVLLYSLSRRVVSWKKRLSACLLWRYHSLCYRECAKHPIIIYFFPRMNPDSKNKTERSKRTRRKKKNQKQVFYAFLLCIIPSLYHSFSTFFLIVSWGMKQNTSKQRKREHHGE